MKTVLLSFFAGIVFLTSCTKEATTSSSITFQLKAFTSPVSGAQIVWTSGTASVSRAKIEAKKNDSSYVEFIAEPNIQVDLFAAIDISKVSIPLGTYRNVTFRTELKSLSSKPSLFLEGIYTAGGVATPISFKVDSTISIKSVKELIEINATNSNYTAITSLTLNTLTTDITEANLKAATRTDGKIIISRISNDLIYFKMLANLAKNQIIEFK